MDRTRLAAAVAALALSLPVHAQSTSTNTSGTSTKKDAAGKTARTGKTSPAKTPAAAPRAPARAQPAPPPQPPPAEARVEEPRDAPERGFFASRGPGSIALGAGLWSAGDASGAAFEVDYGFLHTPPTWTTVQLEWRVVVTFARPTQQTDLARTVLVGYSLTPQTIPTGVEKSDAYVIEVAPVARLRLPLRDRLALYLDAGAGIAQTIETVDHDEMYMGHTVKKENVTGLVVRGALGLSFDLSPRVRVLFAPLAYSGELGTKYSGLNPTLALAFLL